MQSGKSSYPTGEKFILKHNIIDVTVGINIKVIVAGYIEKTLGRL